MVCGSLHFESKFSYDDPKRSSWAAFYEESQRSLAISDKKLNRVFVLFKIKGKANPNKIGPAVFAPALEHTNRRQQQINMQTELF